MSRVLVNESQDSRWNRLSSCLATLVGVSVCVVPGRASADSGNASEATPVPSGVCSVSVPYDPDLAIQLLNELALRLGECGAADSTADLDLCRSEPWLLDAVPHMESPTPPASGGPDPGAGWGAGIDNLTGGYYPDYGVEAKQRVYSSQFLPEGPPNYYLYAPTLEPPSAISGGQQVYSGRYESVVWYKNFGRNPRNMWAVYEHCGSGVFVMIKAMDATFISKYAQNGYIYTQIMHIVLFGSPTWSVWLYNYPVGQWELQVWDYDSTCVLPHQHNTGWDWFEWDLTYGPSSPGECVDIPTVRSFALRLYENGSWKYVTSSWGRELEIDWVCTEYDTSFSSNFYDWSVVSP